MTTENKPIGTEDLVDVTPRQDRERHDEPRQDRSPDAATGYDMDANRDTLDRDAVDGGSAGRDAVERDFVDQDAVNRDAVDRDAVDGDAVDRDAVDRGSGDHDAVERDFAGRDHVDRDAPDWGTEDRDTGVDGYRGGGQYGGASEYGDAGEGETGGYTEVADVSAGLGQDGRATGRRPGDTGNGEFDQAPLFDSAEVERLRGRWIELQAAFVDEPQSAVRDADALVAEVMQTLAATFAEHKRELEGQWQREGSADTEDLRLALRRYRSFFDQLLRT